MKRCSKCDFIYEDDQNLCEMDGGELVNEPALLPPASDTTSPGNAPVKSPWRSFALTAAAALVLGTALAMGFLGFDKRTAHQGSAPPTTSAQEMVPDPVLVEPRAEATSAQNDSASSSAAAAKDEKAALSAVKASRTRAESPRSRVRNKPSPAKPKQQDRSKVGSILKKTGRALKKPFKF